MPYRAAQLHAPTGPRRRRWAALALTLFAGTAGAAGYFTSRRRAAPPVVRAAPAVVDEAVTFLRAWAVRDLPDAPREVVFGSRRGLLARDDTFTFAAERFGRELVSAVPVASGWLFVDAGGTMARADSFLGELHLLPTFSRGFHVPESTVGRAVLVDDSGAVWTTDGSDPLAARTLGPAYDAAFFDARHGGAVLRDGTLQLTADGGASWAAFGLGRDVPWQVAWSSAGLRVETTGGPKVIRWDGATPTIAEGTDGAQGRVALDPQQQERLHAWRDHLRVVGETGDAPMHRGTHALGMDGDREYRCTGRVARQLAPMLPGGSTMFSRQGLGEARIVTRHGAEGMIEGLRWNGLTARGVFTGAAAFPPPGLHVIGAVGGSPEFYSFDLIEASEAGALLTIHLPAGDELAWARSGAEVQMLHDPVREATTEVTPHRLPDGRGLIVLQQSAGARQLTTRFAGSRSYFFGAAIPVSADGTLGTRQGFVGGPVLGVATRAGVSGVVVTEEVGGRVRFFPSDGGPVSSLPRIDWPRTTTCAVPPTSPDALVLRPPSGSGPRFQFPNVRSVEGADEVTLAVLPAGYCIRAAALHDVAARGAVFLHAAPGDQFAGGMHCERRIDRPR